MFLRVLFCLSTVAVLIANENFIYSPETISSKLKSYTEAEQAAIMKDLSVVESVCLGDAESIQDRAPRYIATAGEPGARKTTILERFLSDRPDLSRSAYLDPNPRTMRFMVHTYYNQSLNHRMIALAKNYDELLSEAYHKWQDGSNYIVMTLLEKAFQNRFDIIHGTSSTAADAKDFLTQLKRIGYHIELLLSSCEDTVLEDALEYRNKALRFYQGSLENTPSKRKLFSLNMPIYFELADKLYFYWSTDLKNPERLAAVLDGKTFEVIDLEAYINFVNQYEIDRKLHLAEGQTLPAFEELLSARTGIVE